MMDGLFKHHIVETMISAFRQERKLHKFKFKLSLLIYRAPYYTLVSDALTNNKIEW